MSTQKPMTYADLEGEIGKMTATQKNMPVICTAEAGGGFVYAVWTAPEDMIDLGEGIEPLSALTSALLEEGKTPDEIEAEVKRTPLALVRGQPTLDMDPDID